MKDPTKEPEPQPPINGDVIFCLIVFHVLFWPWLLSTSFFKATGGSVWLIIGVPAILFVGLMTYGVYESIQMRREDEYKTNLFAWRQRQRDWQELLRYNARVAHDTAEFQRRQAEDRRKEAEAERSYAASLEKRLAELKLKAKNLADLRRDLLKRDGASP